MIIYIYIYENGDVVMKMFVKTYIAADRKKKNIVADIWYIAGYDKVKIN